MDNFKVSAVMISKNKNRFLNMIYESSYKCGVNISLAHSFPDLLGLIQGGRFQILIIDAETSNYDENILELFSPKAYYVPHILLAYNKNKPKLNSANNQVVVTEYCDVPFTLSKLADTNIVNQIPKSHSFQLAEDKQKAIRRFLLEIGLCTKYRGFDCLYETIKIMLSNNTARSLTRSVYPVVASKYFTTCSAVERNIRHAITACWQTSNKLKSAFADFFAGDKAPSNRHFLCSLKQLLKEKLNIA